MGSGVLAQVTSTVQTNEDHSCVSGDEAWMQRETGHVEQHRGATPRVLHMLTSQEKAACL